MLAIRGGICFLLMALAANLVLAVTLGAGKAHACSCSGVGGPEKELRASDAVFSGEAVRFGAEDPEPRDGTPMGGVEFRVEEAWKGVSGGTATIYGQGPGYIEAEEGEMVVISSCDVAFERGESYLVYAYHEGEDAGGPLMTHACSGTKPLSSAGKDLQVLDSAPAELPDTGGAPLTTLSAAGGALALALAALGLRARQGRCGSP